MKNWFLYALLAAMIISTTILGRMVVTQKQALADVTVASEQVERRANLYAFAFIAVVGYAVESKDSGLIVLTSQLCGIMKDSLQVIGEVPVMPASAERVD